MQAAGVITMILGTQALHGGTTMILGTGAVMAYMIRGLTHSGIHTITIIMIHGTIQVAGITVQDIFMITTTVCTLLVPWLRELIQEACHPGFQLVRAFLPDL